ncbi:MAG: hypothetical protein SFV23_09680 [Planctomycetaceae bacterium]|nr:hypothetical protein [Planctomycetaceae bacterium]
MTADHEHFGPYALPRPVSSEPADNWRARLSLHLAWDFLSLGLCLASLLVLPGVRRLDLREVVDPVEKATIVSTSTKSRLQTLFE